LLACCLLLRLPLLGLGLLGGLQLAAEAPGTMKN
jgi:hypothetical protein